MPWFTLPVLFFLLLGSAGPNTGTEDSVVVIEEAVVEGDGCRYEQAGHGHAPDQVIESTLSPA
jgi:hypothetical protein